MLKPAFASVFLIPGAELATKRAYASKRSSFVCACWVALRYVSAAPRLSWYTMGGGAVGGTRARAAGECWSSSTHPSASRGVFLKITAMLMVYMWWRWWRRVRLWQAARDVCARCVSCDLVDVGCVVLSVVCLQLRGVCGCVWYGMVRYFVCGADSAKGTGVLLAAKSDPGTDKLASRVRTHGMRAGTNCMPGPLARPNRRKNSQRFDFEKTDPFSQLL